MAKPQPAKRNQPTFPQITFLRWQMTADEKKAWKLKHEKEPFANMDMLDTLLLAEYKVALSYDAGNDTHIATITCKADNTKSPNHGLAFSTRAKTALEALDMALFKHYFCCSDENWARDDDDYADLG